MFGARHLSETAVISTAVFLVSSAYDLFYFMSGKYSATKSMSNIWHHFYYGLGGLLGGASGAALWPLISSPVLARLPKFTHVFVSSLCVALGSSIGSLLFVKLLFKPFWNFEDEDYLPDFQQQSALEDQKRILTYGPMQSKYPRPRALPPVAPQFIDPQLNRLYLKRVFPERLPTLTSQATARGSRARAVAEVEEDRVTKLHKELVHARQRHSASSSNSNITSRTSSRFVTPSASRPESSDEESSESITDAESESESSENQEDEVMEVAVEQEEEEDVSEAEEDDSSSEEVWETKAKSSTILHSDDESSTSDTDSGDE